MSSPVAATCNTSIPAPTPATGIMFEGLDHWLKDFQSFESILVEMANASADGKFKNKLTTTEQWFEVLSEPERTALVYVLLQHSTQEQVHFFLAVLQQMRCEDDHSSKPRSIKAGVRSPSLDTPIHDSGTQAPDSTSKTWDSAVQGRLPNLSKSTKALVSPSPRPYDALHTPPQEKKCASMLNTPAVPMFQESDSGNVRSNELGLPAINACTLNLLAASGLSNDAQLLAVQLVMSGILQPADTPSMVPKREQATHSRPIRKGRKPSHGDSRSPSSSKYPGSVLRSGARSGIPKSSGLKNNSKNSGLASSSLDSTPNEPPRLEDFDPELLNDISLWLRSLRLHKYTSCFEGMVWQEMVTMDDAALEKKGVSALGARRRLLRTFDCVRRKMGVESSTDSAAPTTSVVPSSAVSSSMDGVVQDDFSVLQSAAPRPSADSLVFVPTSKVSRGAASTLQLVVTSTV
ncbi:hypothetical protein AGABI1DRAFT_105717 [Agaricus bisporus var. burnettii JB137-S8]|uniref:SAM domain-containing protein n=2 Tax=Agaricus bisporus var. burnettii TaxID=192524 RepID=K5XBV1_AGABU|nr:uncharacterized protein AGABI1DRAFT_105717 [Agaricus bisporus var. burnettii JB137-S8]EKM80778.1 hypothetical protein AGABI1DRAFT_105717 [Agaricus bisporus var. burnettii JB137-S8]KAF7782391.1 hypothetical protein Agabi119p4_1767 [Agaricus bisporus var. burnettii]